MTCKECFYFDFEECVNNIKFEGSFEGAYATCRRYPPRPRDYRIDQNYLEPSLTTIGNWCGELKICIKEELSARKEYYRNELGKKHEGNCEPLI